MPYNGLFMDFGILIERVLTEIPERDIGDPVTEEPEQAVGDPDVGHPHCLAGGGWC